LPIVFPRGVADATHWNESRRCHLISRKDGFKQPFEFASVAFISALSDAHWCIGGRHGTPRTSPFGAFYLLGALPRGMDLGTPPIEQPSGERRSGCEVDRV
jgi:hypothetical protein